MRKIKNDNNGASSKNQDSFALDFHFEMISDPERVTLFKKAIDKVVKENTIFCELGCGTGIFSIYAAQKAKKVYAVEHDKKIVEIAKKNIKRFPVCHKINLIYGDASEIELPEKVDVVFCEMLSTWLIEEPQVLVMNHARKNLLKPDGITIPEKVINLAELCNMDYIFDNIELKTAITQFTGIKQPRIMTESKVFNTFSFDQENAIEVKGSSEFKALTTGNINSVRLSSIVKIADGINFYSTDSMMPLEIVPLKNQRYVKEEQKIILTGTYKHNDIMNNACFEVK